MFGDDVRNETVMSVSVCLPHRASDRR